MNHQSHTTLRSTYYLVGVVAVVVVGRISSQQRESPHTRLPFALLKSVLGDLTVYNLAIPDDVGTASSHHSVFTVQGLLLGRIVLIQFSLLLLASA